VGFISTGVGAGVLGSGLVLGLAANDAEDVYVAHPSLDTRKHALSLQRATNVTLVVGGVLTLAGVTLVVLDSRKKERPEHATSRSLGVRITASDGGYISMEGSF
jgi:hypothetical protein